MTTPTTARATARIAAVAAAALIVTTGCTDALRAKGTPGSSDAAEKQSASATSSAPSADPSTSPTSASPSPSTSATAAPDTLTAGTAVVSGQCEQHAGETIKQIPDVQIPAYHADATDHPAFTVGGQKVGAFSVQAVDLPAQIVDGGCVIYHDAPGGCLGAVDITGVTIPSATIPGFSVPGVTYRGQTASGDSISGDSAPSETIPGEHEDQVCREKAGSDGYVASVYRPALYRASGYREALYRATAYRESIYLSKSNVTIPSASVDDVSVPDVSVPDVSVPSASLNSTYLPGQKDTTVAQGGGTTSYSTSADVLFEFRKADLKPTARTALGVVAAAIRTHHATHVTVDGFTDSIGSPAFNLGLSRQRAEAVRSFLISAGLSGSIISVQGYGEADPVAPNTVNGHDDPAGRAKNRRVVVSVTS